MSGGLLRSTATVGLNTLASRILGFVRDVIIARLFGASVGADAFFVAFRIPNLLRRLFAEGAFSQAFVPVLSEYRAQRPLDEVRDLAAHTAGALGAVLLAVTVLGIVAAPVLVAMFAPGFLASAPKYDLAVAMLRVTFPYILFISLTSLAAGLLNTFERFGIPAFTPVLLNVSMIVAAVWVAPHLSEPVTALAWGVLFGGVAQLALQIPPLMRLKLLAWPRFRRRHPGVRRVITLMIPALFGVSVAQINLLIDTLIASFLVTGSVSWLYYSDRMVEFPLGVFGIALATVILPSLSRAHAQGAARTFSQTLDWALRWVLVVALPAATGLAVLAAPVLATLFQYGEFGAHDVEMAARSLAAYSFGLLGFVGVKVLAPGYYARQDTRTPVRIAVIALVANMVLNVALVFPLAHAGLALATSLSALLNATLLYRGLVRLGVHAPAPGWRSLAVRVLAANALMAAALWFARGDPAAWMTAGAAHRVPHLLALLVLGVVGYFGLLALMRVPLRALLLGSGK